MTMYIVGVDIDPDPYPENSPFPCPAIVYTDKHKGQFEHVIVLRSTPKKFECEYKDGRKKLVPIYSVQF